MNEWELLREISKAYQAVLGKQLTGIYVHGSIAFGCFCWETSDIDFLVIVEEKLSQQQKEALIGVLLQLDAFAPKKGFEMSVVLRSACMPFQDPTPYELHYSNAYRANYQRNLQGTCERMQGYDPDLAAHMTITGSVGIALFGLPIKEVFAPVPRASYLKSIWYDVENAAQDIPNDPVYYVLNLCRVLAYAEEGLVLSKAQGGEWGMEHLTQDRGMIASALQAYQENNLLSNQENLVRFAENALDRIRQNIDFLSACPKKD